jgi:mono/diheme cytochrome c family protein
MVAALVFVLGFLVLGIAVVLVAFRSGPRRQPEPGRPAQSRASRRLMAIGVTIIVVGLGVAVPLAVAVANGNSHSRDAVGGVTLTAAQADGRSLFAKYCSTCHTLRAANAVGKVGPNLDALHPPKALVLNAIAQGRAQGRGQMPAGLLVGADAQNVASFVAAVAGHE